jgi:hypothetical protein
MTVAADHPPRRPPRPRPRRSRPRPLERCRSPADSGGGYLLVGGPSDVLKEGARVQVEGTVEAGMITTCQQGRPLKVSSAKPA